MKTSCRLHSDQLSTLRTEHDFIHYGSFSSAEEFQEWISWAKDSGLPVLILGNGSNIFFKRTAIRTLVLKNELPRFVRRIDEDRWEASSSELISRLLKICRNEKRDAPYYLISVPAQVGGALAMNAGRGRANRSTVYDYVESVTYLDGDQVRSASPAEIVLGYRKTIFTGRKEKLILSAVFRFPPTTWETDPIEARMQWAKEHQDLGAGNCGTVFKQASGRLMAMLQGVRLGSASYSRKTGNWISNHGKSPKPILALIRMAKLLHWITFRTIKLEWIEVD